MIDQIEIAAGCYGEDGYGFGITDHSKYANLSAVVLKSTSLHLMVGDPRNPFRDIGGGNYWNRVALRNPGIHDLTMPDLPNLRLSLYADNDDDWCSLLEITNTLPVCSVELNLSCPAYDQVAVQDFKRVLSASHKPVYLKLSPFLVPEPLPSGIKGIVRSNSIPYCGGGLSGQICYRPVDIYRLHREIPPGLELIACGGARKRRDIVEYLGAGAKRVQIGSAFKAGTIDNDLIHTIECN